MLAKLQANHGTKSIYLKSKYENSSSFGVQHFAGHVFYDINGFLDKNRDTFGADLKELIALSSNKFLLEIFSSDNSLDTSKRSITLSLQFRNSLEALMKTLSACHPFFIRCIKPNEIKKSNVSRNFKKKNRF
jgi:myosin VIIa